MARTINTVLGPIPVDKLGTTLIHEHVALGTVGYYCDATRYPFNREAIIANYLKTISDAKACGVQSLVDATPADLGRDAGLLKEVSEKSGLNIIAATGFYTESGGASQYFKSIESMVGGGVSEAVELLEKEITQGIQDTGVKAGVMKVATGFGTITPYEKMTFIAAAKVQKATGVPIITHTEAGTMGPEQADLLISEGADPKHIMIGHANGSADLSYHVKTLNKGVYLGFDRFGIDVPAFRTGPDSIMLGCMIALINMGYTSQLMMSHDSVGTWLGKPMPRVGLPTEDTKNWYPTHIHKHIIPALREAGITDNQINTIMVENPRNFFGGE